MSHDVNGIYIAEQEMPANRNHNKCIQRSWNARKYDLLEVGKFFILKTFIYKCVCFHFAQTLMYTHKNVLLQILKETTLDLLSPHDDKYNFIAKFSTNAHMLFERVDKFWDTN